MARTHRRSELALLLSRSLGVEKAQKIIDDTADQLGFPQDLSMDQCLRLLERLAEQPGLVGVVARFAKSQVLLRWAGEE